MAERLTCRVTTMRPATDELPEAKRGNAQAGPGSRQLGATQYLALGDGPSRDHALSRGAARVPLAGLRNLGTVAYRLFQHADLRHQGRKFHGLDGSDMVRARQLPVEREMFLDDSRAASDRCQRDENAL